MISMPEDGYLSLSAEPAFYIQAVLYDIHFDENDDDKSYRTYLEQLAEKHGNLYLHQMLEKVDPASAEPFIITTANV